MNAKYRTIKLRCVIADNKTEKCKKLFGYCSWYLWNAFKAAGNAGPGSNEKKLKAFSELQP